MEERARKAEIRKAKKVAGASKKKATNQVPPSEEPLASASTSSASTSTASTAVTSNLRNRAAPTVAPESEIDVVHALSDMKMTLFLAQVQIGSPVHVGGGFMRTVLKTVC